MKNFLLAAAASICFFTTSASAYVEPADSAAFDPLPWAELTPGRVYLTWTDADRVQPRRVVPAHAPVTADTVSAWRGETIGVRALLYSSTPSAGPLSLSLPGGDARYVRYVITDDQRSCGKHDFSLQPWTVADIIDLPGALPLDGREVRPIWCSVTVPADAPAGPNDYRLTVSDDNGREVGSLSLTVNVDASRTLPPAEQWKFHTDFWQQPYALSRHDGLERWSPEHFEALRPYMRQLARSGQKVVTAILFYEPWGDQSHDKFDPMVATTRRADGSWAFGYDIFDRYVEMMDSCGINGLINCFSMIPWDMSFRYLDEASGEYRTLQTQTSSAEYADLWSAFIKDFAAHLRARGWFDKTCIAMDERGLGAMLDAYALVQQTEPELKMALAGNRHPELVDKLYDYCITVRQDFTPEELEARRKAGLLSTLYTCCTETEPNILSNNNPADAALLPLLAEARGYDGYLHWSWMNWPDEPLADSRFRLFSAGDTYLFYPGPRSSVRYERYIDGVRLVEKIRLLREEGADMAAIDAALADIAAIKVNTAIPSSGKLVENVRRAIELTGSSRLTN